MNDDNIQTLEVAKEKIEDQGEINPIIKSMILSDFFVLSAFAIYGPVFAIFITQQITGGSIETVGLATAAYWLTRSIVQIPISKILDRISGEKTKLWAMIIGSFLFSIVPFLFVFAELPWHIYLFQALYGLGDSLAAPTYLSVFSHHIDRKKENLEWGTRSVSIGIGTSIAAAAGGYLAHHYGFNFVFILTGFFAIFGSCLLIYSKGKILRTKI